MATDATGTPTPLGIPKYNVDADAPSGLGFNAAMDALDALIAARVTKPVGLAPGEVPVWNGTGWDRSSVTRIGAASLGSGTPDATTFLRGDQTWASPPGGLTKLGETLQNTNQPSISVASIAGGHRNLLVTLTALGGDQVSTANAVLRLNGDTGSNYRYQLLYNNGSTTAQAVTDAGPTGFPLVGIFGRASGAEVSSIWLRIFDYASASHHRGWVGGWQILDGGNIETGMAGGVWLNAAAAISTVTFLPGTGNIGGSAAFPASLTVWGEG